MKNQKLWLVLPVVLVWAACRPQKQYYAESGSVFHTVYHIKYEAAEPLTEKIDAELKRFDLSLNPFNEQSVIARVNRNEDVTVDDWFAEVFRAAEKVSDRSNGAFDITCAPLVNLWGFGFSKKDSVTPQAIDSIRKFVGYQLVRLDGNRVVKDDPRVLLNCSAIAKGYACDVIARLLEKEGVENYMVEIGGEITLKGLNPNGNCWSIGVNRPENDTLGIRNDVQETLRLCGSHGVATSGNYRNYYVKDGKMYAHTIDPRSGYPAEQNILSATIVAADCITADAYATAFMALGLEEAEKMAAGLPEIAYFVIYRDDDGRQRIRYSKNMLEYMPDRKKLSELENPV